MADAILALQVLAGMAPAGVMSDFAASGVDTNGDANIGMPEAIYALEIISGHR